ncbi:MAG: VPLPA-CTERM sorting domain-containing protein [Gammaproteobacteria bacterium]
MNISFLTDTPAVVGAVQSTQILSGDIFNTPVPLPAAVWMLGGGLMGLAAFVRRRLHA